MKMKRRYAERTMIFVLVVVAMFMIFTERVSGHDQKDNLAAADAFRTIATSAVRDIMNENYYSNSGVMVTGSFEGKVVDHFTVRISHSRLNSLDDIQKQVLSQVILHTLNDAWRSAVLRTECSQSANTEMTNPEFSIILVCEE